MNSIDEDGSNSLPEQKEAPCAPDVKIDEHGLYPSVNNRGEIGYWITGKEAEAMRISRERASGRRADRRNCGGADLRWH
jgi:hypothetical protein